MQINPTNTIIATGSQVVTQTILSGATQVLTIALNFGTSGVTAFPDANYAASVNVTASASLLGGIAYSITGRTTTTVTVTVKNTGLVSLSLTAITIEVTAVAVI